MRLVKITTLVFVVFLAVPSEPTDVTVEALNSTAIIVKWGLPINHMETGIIKGYHIHVGQLDENEELIKSPELLAMADNGDATEMVIAGLQPEMWYRIQVVAFTRKGDGILSEAYKIKTKGAGE